MKIDFFGKFFKLAFLLIFLAEIASFWAHQFVWLNYLLLAGLTVLTIVLACYKLEYSVYLLLAELFIGSKGQLFFIDFGGQKISIRLAIFAAVFLVWLVKMFYGQHREFFRSRFLNYYLALLAFVVLGVVSGILNNDLKSLFFDLNGWLYFFIAPAIFAVVKNRQAISKVISLLFAAAFYLALKTVGLLLVFVHQLPVGIQTIYAWVRNSGLGEITPMGEGFYRIFFQAHLYAAVAFIFALSFLILRKNSAAEKKYLWLTAVLTSLAVLISLSRSFWLGLLAAVLAMLLILLVSKKLTFIKLTKIVLVMAGMALLEMVFVVLITGNLNQSFFTERFSLNVSEPAAASRLELAGPLWRSVKANWLLGSGFGSEVEYTTLDPRILETNPTGRYTTYAFEWGYLDIWLKIGLLGLLAYLLLLVKMMAGSRRLGSLGPLFIAVLSVLAVTSVFSPYLNHPLGIGLIILIGAMINFYERETD
ncbi:MAG TPA: O-antigen ligase family protein [Patescibacteria group bacterium]|nr:O-antigen ligase family protein [Patescibacteria group bacterium]